MLRERLKELLNSDQVRYVIYNERFGKFHAYNGPNYLANSTTEAFWCSDVLLAQLITSKKDAKFVLERVIELWGPDAYLIVPVHIITQGE